MAEKERESMSNDRDENNYITLYRGVASNIKPSEIYYSAENGVAVPKGLLPDSPIRGGHSDPDDHAAGNNYSIYTSWTTDINTAKVFATGAALGKQVDGVILEKKFLKSRFGKDIIRSEAFASLMQESEWLVPGVQVTKDVKRIKAINNDINASKK
jgi:hypothetical protein